MRTRAARLAYLGAGVAVIVVATRFTFVALAGAPDLYEALVRFPLLNYRGAYRSSWAGLTPLTKVFARDTLPRLLAWLPVALAVPALAAAIRIARGGDRERARKEAVIAVFGGFTILSIAYYPDLIHVAFIGAVLFVAAADALHIAFGALRMGPLPRRVVTAALAAGCLLLLARYLSSVRSEFPVRYASAFGRIDLRETRDLPALDEVRRLLDESPSRELFAYPGQSFVYLVADARNPTRFQFFSPRYNTPEQIADVLAVLESRKVRYVLSTAMFRNPQDPIRRYLRERYQRVQLPGSPRFWLLQRKPEA
jgi:hypothetical protein